jgi:hypothetical protein
MVRQLGTPMAEPMSRAIGQLTSLMPRGVGTVLPSILKNAGAVGNLLKAIVPNVGGIKI